MRAKTAKLFALLFVIMMSVFSFTGCFWLIEATSVELAQVQEPTLSAVYNEEYKNYDVYVEGIVRNDKESALSGEVEITLYDTEGNIIGTAYDYIDRIQSGETWRFCASTSTIFEPDSFKIRTIKGYRVF